MVAMIRLQQAHHMRFIPLLVLFTLLALYTLAGSAAFGDTILLSDDFESGFSGWTLTRTPDWYTSTPKNGTHSIRFVGASTSGIDEGMARTISTAGYQNITVSCYLGGKSLDSTSEYLILEWYNGSTWTELTRVRGVIGSTPTWNSYVSATLPTEANNNANFQLRFALYGSGTGDYAYVDDVMVQGTPIQYTLSLSGAGSGSVTVDGTPQILPWSGAFDIGTSVSIGAVPASGWEFSSWSGDASGSSNPVIITMSGDMSVAAAFTQLSYTLSLTGSGSGSVTVDGTPQTLPWFGSFLSGTSVSIAAVPASGWEFSSWSGDASGSSNPVIITMSGDKSVVAAFTQLSYTLNLAKIGNGTVTVDGIPVALPWSGTYLSGTSVSLGATADTGWEFDMWSGDASGSTTPVAITMDSAKSVTATFTQLSYTLSLTGSGSGSVTVDSTAHTLPWSGSFLSGTTITLEAAPASEWQFSAWSGDASGSDTPTTVTMDGAKSITATFVKVQYTLNLAAVGSGSVTVNGIEHALPWSGSFDSGAEVTLAAIPAAEWSFGGWSGGVTWPSSPVTLTMNGNKSVTATFEQVLYTLAIAAVGSGSVTVNGTPHTLPYSAQFLSGEQVTLQAEVAEGWRFDGWSGDLTWPGSTLIVTMSGAKTLTATFSNLNYTLSIAQVGQGSVQVNGVSHELPWSGPILEDTEVTVVAVPASGWEFDTWSGDMYWSGESLLFTMTGNKSLTATFAERSEFTLSLANTGAGSVRLNGTTVTLPWSGVLARGASVTLEALPDEHWRFDSWTGELTGSANPATFTMMDDYHVTAGFSRIPYQLNLSGIGSGSVEVNGETCTLPWSGTCYADASITLEAVAAPDWRFHDWSGDTNGSDNPITLTIEGDVSVVATFIEPSEFTLTVRKNGSGVVRINGADTELPWTGSFPRGAGVTLEAVAAGIGAFTGWSGDASDVAPMITVAMSADKVITATFVCTDAPFADIPCDEWAVEAIVACQEAGIVVGYPDGLYRPGFTVNRDAMAVFLARAMSGGLTQVPAPPATPTFPDVSADYWAYDAIEYAVTEGVVEGYPDGTYHPTWTVTRGQIAVFIARAIATPRGEAGLEDYIAPTTPTFLDMTTSVWCYRYVEYLVNEGVVAGYQDGFYRPAVEITRDQMAVYIAKAFELMYY